ncbi:CrcB family protein [Jatrophihabitans endophyticus]|uniref:FluC/FEX family fluoride channel n=1 Tax=Jatrophihabitans endophyticus TaxID=1206085 RepID=UPI001A0DB3D8|nr:CrcB family protein [Jatrophihabitans endophyticus]MBE7188885.1 CrcB family protein [Jatrophihabitans endophyticus]
MPDPSRPGRDVIDPDVDVDDPGQRADVGRREALTLAVIAAGGALGAEARYGLSTAWPHGNAAWPWATVLTNLVGSFLLGVLMITVERRSPHHLVRPFLGVGVLGGFTTFSTFALDLHHLLDAGRPLVGLGYAAASLFGCVAATALAVLATRRVVAA